MKKFKSFIFAFLLAIIVGAVIAPTAFVDNTLAQDEVEIIEILNANQGENSFVSVLSKAENYNKNIKLMSDLDLTDIDLSSIWNVQANTTFTGQFDGNGFSIKNITISSNNSNYGLFGSTNGATIKNLKLGGNIVYDIPTDSISQLFLGTIVGVGTSTNISNCEVGDVNYKDGQETFSKILGRDEKIETKTKFTFGGIAGKLESASTLNNCITYLQGDFSCTLSAPSPIKIGGLAGVIDNSYLLNLASFNRINVCATSSNITFYCGGIVGEVQGDKTEVINTAFDGRYTIANENLGAFVEGGVVGLVFSICPESKNMAFNYWTNSTTQPFGENSNFVVLDTNNVKAVAGINYTFLRDISNWHVNKEPWNFNLVWNYTSSRIHLQVFQSFNFNFAADIDSKGVLNKEKCSFNDGLSSFKYGEIVSMNLALKDEYFGYYSLNSISPNLDKNLYSVEPTYVDISLYGFTRHVVSGYKIQVKASQATAGEYSFVFEAIKFDCSVVVEKENGENMGGVRYKGASTTTKNLIIKDLTIESSIQEIEAVAAGRFNFDHWELYIANNQNQEGEDVFEQDNNFTNSQTLIRFKFGEKQNPDDQISSHFNTKFKLVAVFSDKQAIQVGFTGFNREIVTEIKFNGEVYDGENPIKVSSTARVELVVTIKDGYELDLDSFLRFMKNAYAGDDISLLNSCSVTPNEDNSSSYRFSSINMASIQKGLGENKKIDIQIRSIVKQKENDNNLLWLWILIGVGGTLAIASGLIAFFVIRRRNLMRRLGGDGKGNATQSKVKKTKAKEVDYRDYYN